MEAQEAVSPSMLSSHTLIPGHRLQFAAVQDSAAAGLRITPLCLFRMFSAETL